LHFRVELLSERRVVADADQPKLYIVDVAVVVGTRDLVQERVVCDVINLIENNDDGSREIVEFIPENAINFGLGMASFSNVVLGVPEGVYQTDCGLVTRAETVAIE
jgi:hypothetical protein